MHLILEEGSTSFNRGVLFCLKHTLLQLLEGCISSRGGGLLQLEQVSSLKEGCILILRGGGLIQLE